MPKRYRTVDVGYLSANLNAAEEIEALLQQGELLSRIEAERKQVELLTAALSEVENTRRSNTQKLNRAIGALVSVATIALLNFDAIRWH